MTSSATVLPALRRKPLGLWLAASLCVLLGVSLWALQFGLRETPWGEVVRALWAFDPNNPYHIVVREIRLPRLAGALLAGSALGVAGALIQGMTRNPLADPGLLGVNAGASMGVVTAIWVLGIYDPAQFIWVSLAGALGASVLVFFLGGISHNNTTRLILAGAAVTALFLTISRGVLIFSQQTLDVYRYWVLGGFNGIQIETVYVLVPFFGFGLALAAAMAFTLNSLMLGSDTARSLGVRIGFSQMLIGLAIVVLCGATVALAGPIAFVGLVIPHIARQLSGPDMRWLIVFSGVLGAVLLVLADVLGRFAVFGGNLQAGVMVAIIGGPALVVIVRTYGGRKL